MLSKKLILPLLAFSILGTSAVHATNEPAETIKAASVVAGGVAAGAVVGNCMPGPLAAKIVAGVATTALVTPGILLYQNLHRSKCKSLEKYIAISHFYLSPLAAPILGITAGTMIAKSMQTNVPTQIVTGSALATGITAAALGLWTLITLPGAMAGGTGKG